MANQIDRDPVGRRLTPEVRQRAIEFAADIWKGQLGAGEAAQIGIEHVTQDIFKSTE
ncbi:MAG: hypothetical protein PHV43_02000 [Candidatus Colwellbacteria bacterium]|nr:hypothetical protein [Candidatus Colwellbacteria bacterium]